MLMSTPSQPAGRISQVLPSVKCSNCNQPVPLAELGDHICAPVPPLPTPNASKTSGLNIPKPSISPAAAASLLPQRLQGLVSNNNNNAPGAPRGSLPPRSSTAIPPARTASPQPTLRTASPQPTIRTASPQPSIRAASPALSQRPVPSRVNTGGGPSSFAAPPRSSPLSRMDQPASPVSGLSAGVTRARSGSSSVGVSPVSPVTARPSFSSTRETPAVQQQPPAGVAKPSLINTQSGGEAGMAGVGRRGFAAAARAAMFTVSPSGTGGSTTRASPPRNIDTGAASSTSTPPLSTSTGSSGSPGIASYPESPQSPELFSRRRSPSPPSRTGARVHQSSASVSSRSSRYSKKEHFRSESSGSAYGLAYADSTDYEDGDDDEDDAADLRRANERVAPARAKSPPAPSIRSVQSSARGNTRPRKDSLSDSGSDYGGEDSPVKSARAGDSFDLPRSSSDSARGGPEKPSSRSIHSRADSRKSADSSSSLWRRPEELANVRSKPTSDNGASQRSRSPEQSAEKPQRTARKPKICVRCEKKIEDGKWVQMDEGGVLCERCWKNMYLPKCRRCNLPIEKQAVSSSDGQLKGKYHRECFNCHVCHKPFPDKTFYVHEHKPMCKYHYHEANESLCAASSCGQPIEGPCAVSHAGDRYHPDHMLCEYAAGCRERLDDYWEVDGRMLCERHSRRGGDDDEKSSSRAMKRKTRYIELANGR